MKDLTQDKDFQEARELLWECFEYHSKMDESTKGFFRKLCNGLRSIRGLTTVKLKWVHVREYINKMKDRQMGLEQLKKAQYEAERPITYIEFIKKKTEIEL